MKLIKFKLHQLLEFIVFNGEKSLRYLIILICVTTYLNVIVHNIECTNSSEDFYESFARVMSPRGENLSDYDMVTPNTSKEDIAHFWWLEYYESSTSDSSNAQAPSEDRESEDHESQDRESDMSSESSSDTGLSPQIILDVYKTYFSRARTTDDVVSLSMTFMSEAFPKELLAKTIEDLRLSTSVLNTFLEEIPIAENLSENDIYTIKAFRAAITTYNAALLNNIEIDHPMIPKIFIQTIGIQN